MNYCLTKGSVVPVPPLRAVVKSNFEDCVLTYSR